MRRPSVMRRRDSGLVQEGSLVRMRADKFISPSRINCLAPRKGTACEKGEALFGLASFLDHRVHISQRCGWLKKKRSTAGLT